MSEDKHLQDEDKHLLQDGDVEAHHKKFKANDEPGSDDESSDDVEAHKHRSFRANEEPKSDDSDDSDDVEAHSHRLTR
jgi:hypothetical protein